MGINTCANCDKTFDCQRWRSIAFCSDKCRVEYHRKQADLSKRLSAIQALGYETGLTHIYDSEGNKASERLRYFSSHALYIALADAGYVYANGSWIKSSIEARLFE